MAAGWSRRFAETDEWLEIYGETEPRSIALEQIFARECPPSHPLTAHLYVWTLGYAGDAPPHLKVDLLFPARGSWRVKDLQAVVYHLPPVKDERAWRSTLAADLRTAAPIVEAIGQVTPAGPVFQGITAVTAAVTHLAARSAPQMPNDEWYVKRIHRSVDNTLYQGVEWILPPSFVNQIGTRVTGALLVQFIGTAPAHGAPPDNQAPPLLAHAVLTHGKENTPLPGADAYVELPLRVTPEEPLP